MNDSHWLCLDCGKNTLCTDDYYMLRNKLWRQLVPREQRHGMLCLACVAVRLGRPLQPDDFRDPDLDKGDPEEEPMSLDDYGIIDSLTPEQLQAIDSSLIAGVSKSQSRTIKWMVRTFVEESP